MIRWLPWPEALASMMWPTGPMVDRLIEVREGLHIKNVPDLEAWRDATLIYVVKSASGYQEPGYEPMNAQESFDYLRGLDEHRALPEADPVMSLEQAAARLHEMARSGEIVAEGQRTPEARPEQIPESDWRAGEVREGGGAIALCPKDQPDTLWFRSLRVALPCGGAVPNEGAAEEISLEAILPDNWKGKPIAVRKPFVDKVARLLRTAGAKSLNDAASKIAHDHWKAAGSASEGAARKIFSQDFARLYQPNGMPL